jgi:UDP-N-acetylglucosamine diphosphorylase/glucosamine-1-phosphate N-acetyltransferase
MNYILFDDSSWTDLLPLTFTRPVSNIRCGILTLQEKWEKLLDSSCSNLTQEYLQELFPLIVSNDNLLINSSVFPDKEILSVILALQPDETLMKESIIIAKRLDGTNLSAIEKGRIELSLPKEYAGTVKKLNHSWDIFSMNGTAINSDFELITYNRKSEPVNPSVNVFGNFPVFIEKGAKLHFVILNASDGPIYIGKDAEIMEGSLIRGPFALGQESVVKMGAKIYGSTTIGPFCKVGGEINNSVIFAYSNKAHDGFLGNAVVGEWCNFGADSNNSNLKNNYSPVKLWSYRTEHFIDTGLQFCGLIMGDYSKCAINMMFNTGTVIGISTNLFGAGFPRNFIPSFSWGGPQGFILFTLGKAYEAIDRMKERRGIHINEMEKKMLEHIFNNTKKYRHV